MSEQNSSNESRYKHVRGPVTVELKELLVKRIDLGESSDRLAEDIVEIMCEARANPQGFTAALERFKELCEA